MVCSTVLCTGALYFIPGPGFYKKGRMFSSSRADSRFLLPPQVTPWDVDHGQGHVEGLPAGPWSLLGEALFLWGLYEKVGEPEVDQFSSDLMRQPPFSFSFPLERTELKMWVLGEKGPGGSSIWF